MLLTRSLILTLRDKIRNLGGVTAVSDPFALFALHYEPERTSIPEGLPIEHQADAVAEIRSFLPESLQLVVKEHYSQQSSALRGFLGRSPLFYGLIERLPGTTFASFSSTSSELVLRADCVVTLTGTIGVEAALAGKPVLYFGSPWWAGMPGSVRMDSLKDYSDLTRIRVPEAAAILRFLETKILDATVPGLASESVSTMERRFGTLPADFRMVEALAVAHCIEAALTLPQPQS
jgi:CDP-glycerol glycerophosphotransferase (TagB/SpsB family)